MKIKIVTTQGPLWREVLWMRRGLAVTAAAVRSRGWSLTHVATGRSLAPAFQENHAVVDLIRCGWLLTDTLDWRLVTQENKRNKELASLIDVAYQLFLARTHD